MEYIVRRKGRSKGFAISANKEDAILALVRSDQGDGGWSLHSLNGEPDEYLLNGTAKEWGSGWTRPDTQDIRAALALEFVASVALSASVGDFTDDWGQEAYILMEDKKHTKVSQI